MQINLTSQIANISLQIGDEAYFVPTANITTINGQTSSSDQPLFLGVISNIGSDYITLDYNSLSADAANLAADDYIEAYIYQNTGSSAGVFQKGFFGYRVGTYN